MKKSNLSLVVIRRRKHFIIVPLMVLIFMSCVTVKSWDGFPDLAEKYSVKIYRDLWGVPHIYGPSDRDVAFGLAYAHSEDDLEHIEMSLMAARGEMATYKGTKGVAIDFLVKLFKLYETVEEKYEQDLSLDVRKVCEAYADGVNYYATLHPDKATSDLYPVTGKDIVAGFSLKTTFFFGLDDIMRRLMSDQRPEMLASTANEILLADAFGGTPIGSNGFAVSPKKTADGGTFFMSNTHQPWSGPLAWYEAHVHSDEGWEVSGALFPGMPVFGIGHDENKAWTHTVNQPDLIDVYELEINPENSDQYRFDGRWMNLKQFSIQIPVKLLGWLEWTFERNGLWSIHGPVVRRPFGTFAIRYANLEDIRAVSQWFKMNKAENLEEFQEAMEMTAIPSFNTVYADRNANILYIYNGRFPKRDEGFDWKGLIPGDTSAVVWDRFLPLSDVPQVLNPDAGFVQTCNHTPFMATGVGENPDSSKFSHTMGIETHKTNRSLRAQTIFTNDSSLTFDEFLEAKYDLSYSVDSKHVKLKEKIIAEVSSTDPLILESIRLMKSWDHRTAIESREAAITIMTLRELRSYLRESSDAPTPRVMEEAVKTAAKFLMKHHGRLDVKLGKIQRLMHGDQDYPLAGGPDILRAIYTSSRSNGQFIGEGGDSYILAVRWDQNGNMSSFSGHPFGSATVDSTSIHYNDQSLLFAKHELKPVWYHLEDIEANLESVYRPGEEK